MQNDFNNTIDKFMGQLCEVDHKTTEANSEPFNLAKVGQIETFVTDDSLEWYDAYVMSNQGLYIIKETKEVLKPAAFNMRNIEHIEPNEKGKIIEPSRFVMGKLECVNGLAYNPMQDLVYNDNGINFLNSYRAPRHAHVKDHSLAEKLIKGHLVHLFGEGTDASMMLDWMAHQVQHTGKLKRFCPVIVGTYGDGKSTISRIIEAAIGESNVYEANTDNLSASFNGWANAAAICTIEELKINGHAKFEIVNRFKPYVTNKRVSITRKGIDPVTVENVTNYIAYTNFIDAVPVDKGDRRWWVLETKHLNTDFDKDGYSDYFQTLYNLIENNQAEIYSYLNSHVISDDFNQANTAPHTEAKDRMAKESLPESSLAILERIEIYGDRFIDGDTLNATIMQQEEITQPIKLKNSLTYPVLPSGKSLSHAMSFIGYRKLDARQRVDGVRCTMYVKK
ncbi:TPA: primase-helicase family protein [Vibrio cholerae]